MQPVVDYCPELLLKAQGISVVFFDVDGVLTDGGLYFSAGGETLKRFHVLDGYGLALLQSAGIVAAVISGRDSEPLRLRVQALGITHAHYGAKDKALAGQAILQSLGMSWSQAAAMGDDWPDLPLMRRCAFSAAPPNAHAEVIAAADYVATRPGGQGAVRDLCDVLLVASGQYAGLLQRSAA